VGKVGICSDKKDKQQLILNKFYRSITFENILEIKNKKKSIKDLHYEIQTI